MPSISIVLKQSIIYVIRKRKKKKKVYQIDYYIANNVIILVGDGGLICQMNLSGCLNHKVVINDIRYSHV